VQDINSVYDKIYDEEDIGITFDLEADIRKLFSWNTNLVYTWISVEYQHARSVFFKIRAKTLEFQSNRFLG